MKTTYQTISIQILSEFKKYDREEKLQNWEVRKWYQPGISLLLTYKLYRFPEKEKHYIIQWESEYRVAVEVGSSFMEPHGGQFESVNKSSLIWV